MVGDWEGVADGDALGAAETVGLKEGIVLGVLVGGSVFKMHRDFRALDNAWRSKAWTGRTPRFFPGLLSIIHNADPLVTLLSSPTPIAKRSTFNSSSAASSEVYWVAAFEFMHLLGPRTQSWYFCFGTHLLSFPRQISWR